MRLFPTAAASLPAQHIVSGSPPLKEAVTDGNGGAAGARSGSAVSERSGTLAVATPPLPQAAGAICCFRNSACTAFGHQDLGYRYHGMPKKASKQPQLK